jgi:hypothetical protein
MRSKSTAIWMAGYPIRVVRRLAAPRSIATHDSRLLLLEVNREIIVSGCMPAGISKSLRLEDVTDNPEGLRVAFDIVAQAYSSLSTAPVDPRRSTLQCARTSTIATTSRGHFYSPGSTPAPRKGIRWARSESFLPETLNWMSRRSRPCHLWLRVKAGSTSGFSDLISIKLWKAEE